MKLSSTVCCVLEAFEMDNQNGREAPNVHLEAAIAAELFAIRTVSL